MIKGADARINFSVASFRVGKEKEREFPFFHTGKGNGKSRTNNMGKITNVAEINAESKLVKIAKIFLSLVILYLQNGTRTYRCDRIPAMFPEYCNAV